MKSSLRLIALPVLVFFTAMTASSADSSKSAKLTSDVYSWDKLVATTTPTGVRRAVLDGPTATVDTAHVHITTLNPGAKSGDPRVHHQEEIIIVKEGTVEAHWDGKSKTATAGSVIFFASGATTFLENKSKDPATYIVIYYFTPLTPKG